MNAKKIMGAVLVALLAAALFVGAASAAEGYDYGTVFVNQNVTGLSGTWTNGANSITAAVVGDKGYFTGANIVEGTYTKVNGTGKDTIYVKYPAITVIGVAGEGNTAYNFIDGVYYNGTTPVTFDVADVTPLSVNLYLTKPNGEEILVTESDIKGYLENGTLGTGKFSVRGVFGANGFALGTLYSDLITKPVTYTVAKTGDVGISASVDSALKSAPVKITITGQPGVNYTVQFESNAFQGSANQIGLPGVTIGATGFQFDMPNTGSVEFIVTAGTDADDSEKMTVFETDDSKNKATVSVKFTKGTITAAAGESSYFVGTVVDIAGTTTAGEIEYIYIKGTNFEANLTQDFIGEVTYGTEAIKTFELEVNTSMITNEKPGFTGKKLDVGTYTITLVTDTKAEATAAVVLKQPFISIVSAPEVIVQETDVEFVINAEAATGVAYYIFGTNYFKNGFGTEDEDVENQYVVKLNESTTYNMSAGQYFSVFQHPMYDCVFNILSNATGDFFLSTDGTPSLTSGTPIFSFNGRQTANAAQALCDALDSQNIDDMYVKYSFFVVGEDESFTISEIPTSVAQGETITISGVSTANAEKYVTVEMISTAFAAVPKETVGSAAFIVVTTQVAEDGTWEVTLDTSDLNVDEYSLKVACGDDTWKNVKINVVEGAETPDTPDTPDVPDTPDTPDTPTEPETPGFGALAALAGLGAVAVLLLRRE